VGNRRCIFNSLITSTVKRGVAPMGASSITQSCHATRRKPPASHRCRRTNFLTPKSLRWSPRSQYRIGHETSTADGERTQTQARRSQRQYPVRMATERRVTKPSTGDRKGHRRRDAEVTHLGEGFVGSFATLHEATLPSTRHTAKQGTPLRTAGSRESRQPVRNRVHVNTLQNAQQAQPKSTP